MKKSLFILVTLAAALALVAGIDAAVWGQSGNADALDNLIGDLSDKSWQIRWYAVTGLGDSKDRRAVEPLIATLKNDENTYVRATTAWALGEINDDRAVAALIAALDDESHGVKKNALLALKTMTGRDFGPDAAAWREWWAKQSP